MYDRAYKIGRMGFEIQYRLMADPRFLNFDRSSKKLGTRFDEDRCGLEEPMPKGWYLVADPTKGSSYVDDDDQLPGPASRYFLTDHHTRLADSVGYQTYRTYQENKRIVYQLELVSKPFERDYQKHHYIRHAHRLYNKNLAELLDLGVVSIFPGKEKDQQGIQEQINLEIDDVSWAHRVSPMRKLACLSLGMWVFTRYREHLGLDEDSWLWLLLKHFDDDISLNQKWGIRYDLFANMGLLMEGWLHGLGGEQRLTWRRLKHILASPAHVAILAQCLDNNFCSYYFHGMQRLTAEEMRRVSPRDFQLFRELGIDSMFLDCFAGEPQEHLNADAYERYNVPFLRTAMGHFCDMDQITQFVRSCVFGEGHPGVGQVQMPLFHLRKTINPGCLYLELRTIHKVKGRRHKRYPYKYRVVNGRRTKAKVIQIDHLWQLGTDCSELFEMAMAAGQVVLRMVEEGDQALKRRRIKSVDDRLAAMARYLAVTFQRPTWE